MTHQSYFEQNEARILSRLFGMHKEASRFYEETLERVDNPRHHRALAELERLHDALANELYAHMIKNGHHQIYIDMGLFSDISPRVTSATLDKLENAEQNCFLALLSVLYNQNLTESAKTLLRHHMHDLQKSQDYMRSMRH